MSNSSLYRLLDLQHQSKIQMMMILATTAKYRLTAEPSLAHKYPIDYNTFNFQMQQSV